MIHLLQYSTSPNVLTLYYKAMKIMLKHTFPAYMHQSQIVSSFQVCYNILTFTFLLRGRLFEYSLGKYSSICKR